MSIEIQTELEKAAEAVPIENDIIEEKTLRKLDSTEVPSALTKADSKESGQEIPAGTRVDRNGIPIIKSKIRTIEEKKKQKYKVTFIDKVEQDKELS